PATTDVSTLSLHDALPICRFTNGGAANHFLNQVTFFVDVNVSFVWRSEKVMAIAHDFLISADKHEREIVSFAGLELVQFEHVLQDRKSTRLNSSHEWISYA